MSGRLTLTVMSQLEHVSLFLFSAADLSQGLENRPRWKQARLFRDWADETLRTIEVRHMMQCWLELVC